VDISTAVSANLTELDTACHRHVAQTDQLVRSIDALRSAAKEAVGSLLGLSITVTVDSQDVTLTSVDGVEQSDVGSSLQLPLSAITPLLDGVAVLYAGKPEAFVDLAQELHRLLGRQADGLRLDENLATGVTSGLTGVEELSKINRAIGVLIDRGHTVAESHQYLQRQANAARVRVHQAAERLLETVAAPLPTSETT
jgi:hypothetical protein